MDILLDRKLRMTSLELVEVINKFREMENLSSDKRRSSAIEHKSVMRKIREEAKVLQSLNLYNETDFALSSYMNTQNKEQACYLLSRDGVIQMCAKESPLVRYKLIEYMNLLEKELGELSDSQRYRQSLLSLIDLEQKKIGIGM